MTLMKDFELSGTAIGFSEDIIAAASCGIVVFDDQGQCVLANPKAAEIVGATVAQLRQQNFRRIDSWRTSGLLALAEQVLATGEKHKQDFHAISSFGKELWIGCKLSVFERDGRRYLLLVTVDNTKRVAAEQAAVKARNFLQQIINTVADPIFVKDRQHRYVLLNDVASEFAGRTAAELIGKTPHALFPAAEADAMRASDEEFFLTGKENTHEHLLTDRQGIVHHNVTRKTLYKDEQGNEYLVGVVRNIAPEKKMEAALRESEALYQSLVRELPCGIFRKDAAGRYVFVNDQFCRTNGLNAKDMLGRTPKEFGDHATYEERVPISGELLEQRIQLGKKGVANHEHIMRTGESILVDEVLVLADSSRKYFQVIKSPVRDLEGKVVGSQGIQFEITERVLAEDRLQKSESQYRMLFENMTQGLVCFRVEIEDGQAKDLTYVAVNAAYTRLTGRKNVVGRRISEVLPGIREADPELFERYARVAQTGQPEQFEINLKTLKQWCAVSAFSPQQNLVVAVFDFINERKQVEEQLRKLSRAVEQSSVSIVITDRQAHIEYVNPKFVEMTGYTFAEVAGKHPLFLQSGEPVFNQESNHKTLWATITSGQEWHGEFHNKRKNGEGFWEAVAISPIKSADGFITHFVIIKEDITKQKQLEDEFRQAQKMEAFGNLAAGVAHDFNNLLTAILGNVEIINAEAPMQALQQESMVEIAEAAERAANLTRQLLLFSRRKAMRPEVLELNEVVENMSKMLRRLLGENLTLQTRYGSGTTPVMADSGMLEQVLMNLAVNSRDAMPKGGELMIETELLLITEATPRRRIGHFVCLTVRDTGSGITPQDLEHIFEPFFTTKEVGKGTGLGLATVFGIIEQHKGWIEVESRIGKGTAFHLYLPRHEKTTETEFITRPKPANPSGVETILLVEDEAAVRKLARNILQRFGYHVLEADSPVTALEFWREHHTKIALLFTDMVMPGQMTGLELSQQLLAEKPSLKVIYTSGYTDEMLKEGSALRESPNFLQKPYLPDELLKTVRTALDT